MPSLQIRDLPADLYNELLLDAKREHRSLTQQAVVELREARDRRTRDRRRDALRAIQALDLKIEFPLGESPEDVIRQIRDSGDRG